MNSLPTFSDVTEQALAKEPDHHDISTNTPESMPARERAGVHAGLQVCMWRPQACTYVVHTCTSMCMPARGSCARARRGACVRSEEHTSELQSRPHLVCRLLLEKKKIIPGRLFCCSL